MKISEKLISMARKIFRMMPVNFRDIVREPLKDIIYMIDVDKYLKRYDFSKPPLFEAIEIETLNRCNGKCTFCPVNANEKQRKYAKMSRELFDKIILELERLDYSGKIALFSNNEPFLDERIIEWNRIVRNKLPKAYVYLYTNGSLLNLEKVTKIIKYLDELVIDNYDENVLSENLKGIKEWKQTHDEGEKIVIVARKRDEILTTRGGQAPNKKKGRRMLSKCFLPYKQVVVRPDGKISLCCNDALGVYTMGDLNKQTLLSVWNSRKYQVFRSKMKRYGRTSLKLCRNCDTKQYIK